MNIPFFNYSFIHGQYKQELSNIILNLSEQGSFILQQELSDFEKNLANYCHSNYSVGVGNCTDALYLSLKAAGIGKGHEVIFSSHTFVATASAIHNTGATPVPVECGEDHLIDTKSIESAINSRTRAIVPTQLNGQVCDMEEILEICEKHSLILIEDSAQSLGAKYNNKAAGSFGLTGCFSFYPAKVVGCYGDGGAVVTSDDEIYDKIFLLRDHGRKKIGEVVTWGINSRLDNIQAAILDFKLKKYHLDIDRRREIASKYIDGLAEIDDLKMPRKPGSDKRRFEIFQNFEIEIKDETDRDKFRQYLSNKGVGTILQWGGKAVHEWKGLNFKQKLPFTESVMRKSFLLPMNTSLNDKEINYIIETIQNYFK